MLAVHLEDGQAAGGDFLAAVATGHPLSGIDAARGRTGTGRTGLAVVLRTVGHRTPAEAVALLVASEAAADGVTADVHLLAGFEIADGDGATEFKTFNAVDAVFAQMTQKALTGFVEVTLGGLVDQLLAGFAKADLHCGITVSVVVFELGDAAGAGFDQGDRNSSALLVEELGHTQLLPEDADGHGWGGSASVDNHQAENRMGSGADRLDADVVRSGTPEGVDSNGLANDSARLGLASARCAVAVSRRRSPKKASVLAWGFDAIVESVLPTGGPASGRAQIGRANKNPTPLPSCFHSSLINCQTHAIWTDSMPLLLSGRGFRRELESAGVMAVHAPLEGGAETRLLRRLRAAGYRTQITSARGLGDPEVFLFQKHGVRPPHLGHQSVGRGAAVGEVQEVMPQLGELLLGNKPVVLWLIEGQVLSRSELLSLCDLCRREPRLKVVVEMGGARSLRWQPMTRLLGA